MTRSSLAFIASCALEEAACLWSDDVRKLSSKFAVIQKEGGCPCWKNINQWKRRTGVQRVLSGLCSHLIEIWEAKLVPSG